MPLRERPQVQEVLRETRGITDHSFETRGRTVVTLRNAGITVGELRRLLALHDEDAELYVGGLTFFRLKDKGPKLVQMQFNQGVYEDERGKIIIDE